MGIEILNATNERPSIALYGSIGDDFQGVTAAQVGEAIAQIPRGKPFDLHIYSDGGSFDEAMAIHALISARAKSIRGIVDGLAASAASLILQATGDRVMSSHSRQMIHAVRGRALKFMTADGFREMATQMDAINSEITKIYASKWKGTKEELQAALDREHWMDAQQSVDAGLADRVGEASRFAARVNIDLFQYENVPEDVIQARGSAFDQCENDKRPFMEILERHRKVV